jgi:hypothetical protein
MSNTYNKFPCNSYKYEESTPSTSQSADDDLVDDPVQDISQDDSVDPLEDPVNYHTSDYIDHKNIAIDTIDTHRNLERQNEFKKRIEDISDTIIEFTQVASSNEFETNSQRNSNSKKPKDNNTP